MDRVIQLTTLVAIVIGVGLVVWELQQVRVLTRAQLTSEYASVVNAVNATVAGEELGATLAKACESPTELTLEEGIILQNHYLSLLNLATRIYLLSERDGLYDRGIWKPLLAYLNPIYDSYYGQAWLRGMQSPAWPDGLIDAAIEDMDRRGTPDCLLDHEETLDAVRTMLKTRPE